MGEPKIELRPNGLAVTARYELTQVQKRGGAWKVWRGQARWFLTREEGKLKVQSLNYQHD